MGAQLCGVAWGFDKATLIRNAEWCWGKSGVDLKILIR